MKKKNVGYLHQFFRHIEKNLPGSCSTFTFERIGNDEQFLSDHVIHMLNDFKYLEKELLYHFVIMIIHQIIVLNFIEFHKNILFLV